MSAETDFRAALVAHAPLLAVVPQARITLNAAEPGAVMPYIVFSASHAPEAGMDGTPLGDVCTISVQCWARTALQAAQVADLVTAALVPQGCPPTAREGGYDPELGADAELITFEWLTG